MKKLLILGAGGHGKVVAEIAAACGYSEVCFLDDKSSLAIGKLEDAHRFADTFGAAFVAIGNNKLRSEWMERLVSAGYALPSLIHPDAYVSPSAKVGDGTVIGPKAVVNTGSVILKGCIVSAGVVVDHDAEVHEYVHLDAGAVVSSNHVVEKYTKLGAGQIA